MRLIAILFLSIIALNAKAQPKAEEGYKWVKDKELSDEFKGSKLNLNKWENTQPKRWIGRQPGLFCKEAVSVKKGNLRITADQFDEPRVVKGKEWTHQGGHVISRKRVKPGSYIECRMKGSKTFMSSTFWLINVAGQGKGCERRTTELDVQECVGYPANLKQTQSMGSNTHSRGVREECKDEIETGSVGNRAATPGKTYDDYYTYGVWWKGPREILFYLNDEYQYTIEPKADFDLEMYIKLVVETYNWNPAPADGGMTGSFEERTTYYDFVHTYEYVKE